MNFKRLLSRIPLLLLIFLVSQQLSKANVEDPDKACIFSELTPDHIRIDCYGEGAFCSNYADCLNEYIRITQE